MNNMILLLKQLERQGVKLALNDKGQLISQSSKEAVTPQIATEFFEFFSNFLFTFCSPSIALSPADAHPRFLSITHRPHLRL